MSAAYSLGSFPSAFNSSMRCLARDFNQVAMAGFPARVNPSTSAPAINLAFSESESRILNCVYSFGSFLLDIVYHNINYMTKVVVHNIVYDSLIQAAPGGAPTPTRGLTITDIGVSAMSKPNVTPLNAVPGVFVSKPCRTTRDFFTRTNSGLVWLGRYPRKAAYTKGVISSVRCRAQQVRQLAAGSEQKGAHHE